MEPYVSIILPAYNEAERLPITLVDMDKKLERADFSYEIVVVSDGSTDATADIVSKMAATIKNLKLIDRKENLGKGATVKQGMLESRGQIRLFMDADNATTVEQFEKMIPFFKEGYGVVIGSRAVAGAEMDPPEVWYRRVMGRVGNWIIQLTNVPGINDTQCGFKAFTAEAAQKIFPLIKTNGWAFDVEALALARSRGFKIHEIPVQWVDKAGSKLRLSAYLKFFLEDFTIRWWFITGQYKAPPHNT